MTADELAKLIPPEAVEAAAKAKHKRFVDTHPGYQWPTWDSMTDPIKAEMIDQQQAAILAALRAWPGVREHSVQVPDDNSEDIRYVLKPIGVILPLTQENADDVV